ncbi:MAG: CapA family protein [Actinomycetota bacterium]|nr:CapA family protein [Actinomycetota bacterium]
MSSSRFAAVVVLGGGLFAGVAAFSLWNNAAAPAAILPPVAIETTTTAAPTTTTTVPPSTTAIPPTTTTTEEPKGTLVIHGTGDVAVDPNYIPALRANGWDYAWTGLDGLFIEDDLTVVNLECVPSDIGTALNKAFVFRCPTEALPSVLANGVEVANMGNNHSGDYGKDALVDGRAQLLAAGIAPVGAGADFDEAGAPALFEINGWTVAVIGFGGVAPSPSWFAAEDRPGMRSGDHIDEMVNAVLAADELADIVIVTIHWGRELETEPNPDDIPRALAMIEAGADIIFGHHQHRLNPLEMVNGAAVFWGLGNFVWPHNSIPSATTAVARAVVHPDGSIEACLIPAFIETHGHPVLTGEPECGPGS